MLYTPLLFKSSKTDVCLRLLLLLWEGVGVYCGSVPFPNMFVFFTETHVVIALLVVTGKRVLINLKKNRISCELSPSAVSVADDLRDLWGRRRGSCFLSGLFCF